MENNILILLLWAIPVLGFFASLILPSCDEKWISRLGIVTLITHLTTVFTATIFWGINDFEVINIKQLVLYKTGNYEFFIDFYFDEVTAVFLLIGSVLSFLIFRYSSYYMHMEPGYKRFFSTILLFYMGYNWIVLSGNFETLFIGWEIIGAASFLLIAFYRMRYLPSKNAVKVFSIYRIGDIGILAVMWASHHLWHENITFLKLQNQQLVHHHLTGHSETGIFIGIMILLSAAVKSAQFPFSSWLPRAMEGPTPSSAIFYGSLSVHFGAFLLIRTYPFWEGQLIVKACVITVGIITVLVHSMIARAQSTIKAQIAYSSSAQIGFIFIEIALGFHYLALIHFAGNALLRSYQLLISPSAVSFLLRQKTFSLPQGKIRRNNSSLYILALKEWNLDYLISQLFFTRVKKVGKLLGRINTAIVSSVFIPLYLFGLIIYFQQETIPVVIIDLLPEIYVIISFIMVVRAFAERTHPRMAWILVLFGFLNMALGISFNEHFEFYQTELYSLGVFIAGIFGFISLQLLRNKIMGNYDLNSYHGYSAKYPGISLLFLLSALGISGFPITTAFIGEDLLFSHIHDHQFVLLIFTALTFVFGGIAVIRIYARLFLGNNSVKSENSFLKSS